MPVTFKSTYPSTRCIDCTELFCHVSSSLPASSALYSHYKHHVKYKRLLGIAPSGAVIFISQLYDVSTSDQEIVRRSGILNAQLWNDNDSVMADRGFLVSNDLAPFLTLNLTLQPFYRGDQQLTTDEVKESIDCFGSH